MTGTYDATAKRALDLVRRKGAVVTFSFDKGDGTYLADLDIETYQGPVTVAGFAIRDDQNTALGGRPIEQQAGTEITTESPTLLFAPSTPGQLPSIGMLVTWGGHAYSVKAVDPIAPAGTPVVASVVIGR